VPGDCKGAGPRGASTASVAYRGFPTEEVNRDAASSSLGAPHPAQLESAKGRAKAQEKPFPAPSRSLPFTPLRYARKKGPRGRNFLALPWGGEIWDKQMRCAVLVVDPGCLVGPAEGLKRRRRSRRKSRRVPSPQLRTRPTQKSTKVRSANGTPTARPQALFLTGCDGVAAGPKTSSWIPSATRRYNFSDPSPEVQAAISALARPAR
jgi:hypothetical protein